MTSTITTDDAPRHLHDDEPRARWQPTRAGIVNVWRYADEVLHFHRGRLLLRGPNGSGKSMALELLLPFLLDANASPHRMSSAQRSRGGLYDRIVGGTTGDGSRVGFLWVEFRRRERDGAVDTCTLGVRLRASASTRQVDKAWFVTPQRVGHDLDLLDDNRVPLAAAAFDEALSAGGGHLYDDATSYRERVRERLFPRTTETQYDAIITALLALRQEKLSQNLDLERLSATLTSALPPLDARDIADAAEGFRQLDQRRDNLAQLEQDLDTVGRVARRQRAYARTLLRAAAGSLIAAQSRRDTVVRTLREATEARDAALDREAAVVAERRELATRVAELAGRIEALRQREAFRAGETLEALRQEAARAATAAQEARRQAGAARQRAEDAAEQERQAAVGVHQAAQLVTAAWSELASTAGELAAATTVDAAAEAAPDAAEPLVLSWIDGRTEQLTTVRARLRELDDTVRARDDEQHRADDASELRERRVGERGARTRELDTAIGELRDQVADWLASLTRLPADQLTDLTRLGPDDLDRAHVRVEHAATPERDRLARLDGELAARDRDLADEQDRLQAQRDELATATEPTLPVPPWRRDRQGLPGAPLWRLLDFTDDIPDPLRDRVEAALHTAGVLDAWVAPDGALSVEGDPTAAADLVAVVAQPAQGPTLLDVLRPEQQDAVPVEVVRGLLGGIALVSSLVAAEGPAAPAEAAVGRDGTFRFATIAGAAPHRPAGFIGAAARERQRQRQLARLDAELDEVARQRSTLASRRAAVTADRGELEAEVENLPSVAAAAAAQAAMTKAGERLRDADEALQLVTRRLREAEKAARAALRSLHTAASDADLPTTADALDAFERQLRLLERRTGTWISRRRDDASRQAVLDSLHATASFATTQTDELDEAAAYAADRHADVRGRLDALEQTVGVEYREVVALIDDAEAQRRVDTARDEQLQAEQRDLSGRLGRLNEKLEAAERDRDAAEHARDDARAHLAGMLRDRFAEDADVSLPADDDLDGVTVALEAARTIARELADVVADEHAISRAQIGVSNAAHDAGRQLGGRADLTFSQARDGWWLLRARTEGLERSITQLEAALARDLQLARDEFAEHERELYDRTLTEGLRRHLVDRIRAANELTDRINCQLHKVRTAAHVGVQLDWTIDDAVGTTFVSEARPLLLKDPHLLSGDEVATLHRFLRARIDAVRAGEDDTEATWEGRLTAAFDYRTWHRFGLKVSHQEWGDEFRPATSRRLAQLSTGERSVVLHLPMLASIAAHYDATPDVAATGCPRLILLDELFVGVDPVNRAQLFGMFVEWDLDAVLTSDTEWCRYRELDGIAIHQVHADADPVVTTRFLWDGAEQRTVPVGDDG